MNRTMRGMLRTAIIGLGLAGVFTAPMFAQANEPVTFTFAHPGPIRTMDAPVTWFGSTHWLTNSLYDCLIWRNADGSGYHGQAAERWSIIDDEGTVWRFHLRPGLTFHNGEPLDAHAVKWNLERVQSRDDFMVSRNWQFYTEVRVIDDLTIDLVTAEPFAYFEHYVSFNGCQLLPPGYLEEVGEEEFAANPVGSGPFKLVQFTPNDRYVFEAWDDYWGGRPEVDRVIYQVIPEAASQVAALLAGGVDLVRGVPEPDQRRLVNASGITTMTEASGVGHELRMRSEIESGGFADKFPGYVPPTVDRDIREAVYRAIDRNLLASIHGDADLGTEAFPKLIRGSRYAPEVTAHADWLIGPDVVAEYYDPELARELIIRAGYDLDAGERPRVVFDAPDFQQSNEKETAELIAAMLEAVGFEVELNILGAAAYEEQIVGPGNNRGLWLGVGGTSVHHVATLYLCDRVYTWRHICYPEWDEIAHAIMTTVDLDERVELWGEFWEWELDVAVNQALFEFNTFYAMNDRFEWQPRADGWMTFRDLRVRD